VTQSQGNRNLSKSLPKRFGLADLAIDSLKSQEGAVASRFKLEHFVDKKVRCNTLLWQRSSNFCFKLAQTELMLGTGMTTPLWRLGRFNLKAL
jgi:hypothetical protein